MSRRRWIGLVAVVFAVALVAGLVFLAAIFDVMNGFAACRIVRQSWFASPNGSNSVVVVWKECGATVPDRTQAGIVRRGRAFSSDKEPTFLSVRGHQDVLVAWSSEQAVKIGFIPGTAQIYKRDQRAGDVTISYD
ncbi:hypothetical protein LPJ38_14370 [Bradyrhizobium daqingense]|uniref:Uncharacterized protein n=1 Tax=Bradyrhizobium daqingense TaxID=993502 RepID=A0A562L959_9BRAD|nr:hypothetical protein [Bradyrhizobium daqingense]TWI04207.1 hypothetical protein IQ17_03529 [Bradyrhizobium daqingense]UFS91860.1 hypothetical protein LPJ38_14370 [Bradyrhizobium daqingense]